MGRKWLLQTTVICMFGNSVWCGASFAQNTPPSRNTPSTEFVPQVATNGALEDELPADSAEAIAVKKSFDTLSKAVKSSDFDTVASVSTETAFREFFSQKIFEAIAQSSDMGPSPGKYAAFLKKHGLDKYKIEDLMTMDPNDQKDRSGKQEELIASFKNVTDMQQALSELARASKSYKPSGPVFMEVVEISFAGGDVLSATRDGQRVILQVRPKLPGPMIMMDGPGISELQSISQDGNSGPPAGVKSLEIIDGPNGPTLADGSPLPSGVEVFGVDSNGPQGMGGPGMGMMGLPDFYVCFVKSDKGWMWDGLDESRMMEGMAPEKFEPIEDPKFSGKAFSGKEINLDNYKGKVVLLDFWGTWCKPCVAELPKLKAVYEFLNHRGFEIVGIAQDDHDTLEKFFDKRPLPWENIVDGTGGQIARKFNVMAFPTTMLIDRAGNHIASHLHGPRLVEELQKALDLDESTVKELKAIIKAENNANNAKH